LAKYFFDGKEYPRVTSILKLVADEAGLEAWKKREPRHKEISERAMKLGTLMHYCIANELSPVPIEIDNDMPISEWPTNHLAELSSRMNHFRRLRMTFDKNPVLEHVVRHDGEGEFFAGTCDFRGNINGQRSIADWKNSKRIRPEYTLQIGAYYIGSLHDNYKAERGFVVRLQRDEKEVLELDHEALVDAGEKFLDLARRWHKQNDLRKDGS
jgi:hypothetical protein